MTESMSNAGGASTRRKWKRKLSEAQNHRCCYCYVTFDEENESPYSATFEHVIPTIRGGLSKLENLVLCCNTCNNIRGDRISAENFSELIQNGQLDFLMAMQSTSCY